MSDWEKCAHEWEVDRSDWDLLGPREYVECKKCGCPGERNTDTGEVYWPAT